MLQMPLLHKHSTARPAPSFVTPTSIPSLLQRRKTTVHSACRIRITHYRDVRPRAGIRISRRRSYSMSLVQPPSDGGADLLIVGAGDLGLLVGGEWLKRNPSARVIGLTATERTHNRLRRAGISPITYSDNSYPSSLRATNILFAIPPPKVPHYDEILAQALSIPCSKFIFISSTGVHASNTGPSYDKVEVLNEHSPIGNTKRAQDLYRFEQIVLSQVSPHTTPLVIRLCGLYSLRRGAHMAWAGQGKATGRVTERRTACMLHRYDAAKAVLKAFDMDCVENDNLLLISSTDPLSPKEMCDSMRVHPEFKDSELPTLFADKVEIRRTDASLSRQKLDWNATWESFAQFMHQDAQRVKDGIPSGRLVD